RKAMSDLIERLNDAWRKLYDDGDEHDVCDTIAEAAAALEAAREDAAEAKQNGYELGLLAAAREDAERWRQAFVDERASRYRADGMKVEQARIHAETDAVVAAIDQARRKGVA